MKYTSLSLAAVFGNAMASAASSVSEKLNCLIIYYYIYMTIFYNCLLIHPILYTLFSIVICCIYHIIILSNTQPHGGGGSISIHPKRMDVGAISFGNHQGPVVMKEARFGGGIDGNVSTASLS